MNKLKVMLLICPFTFQINSNPLKALKTAGKYFGHIALQGCSLGGMAGTAENIGDAVIQYPFKKSEEKSKKKLAFQIISNGAGFVIFGGVMLKSVSKFIR